MSKNEIQLLLDKANESHAAANLLIDKGFIGFSAAQSYTPFFIWSRLCYCRKV